MNEKEIHLCPLQGRTVIFENEKCMEKCERNDCPLTEYPNTESATDMQESVRSLTSKVLDQFSLDYNNLMEAKKIEWSGQFYYSFDALSLCPYEHNMDFQQYQEFTQVLREEYHKKVTNKEDIKQREERVSLFHYLLSPSGADYIDYQIRKRTRPDFVLCGDKRVGIEVVRLTTSENEILFAIAAAGFGKKLSASEIKEHAMKKHKTAGNYSFWNVDGHTVVGSGLFDVNQRHRLFAELLHGKYEKYRDSIKEYDRFIILGDAQQSKAIEVTTQYDADWVVHKLKDEHPDIQGVTAAIIWESGGNSIFVSQYDL